MAAALDSRLAEDGLVLRPRGAWVIGEASRLEAALGDATRGVEDRAERLVIDLSSVEALDTAGRPVSWIATDRAREALIDRVRQVLAEEGVAEAPRRANPLGDIGERVAGIGDDMRRVLGMLGAVVTEAGRTLTRPRTFRGTAVVRQMEMAGLRAVPIITLMSFLIGGIIAQQGAFQLRYFGAEVFTVDLVGILSLREVATLLTAVMVAGRSGSAMTAELGSMRMREEIDALRVMGLDPVNVLVLPRVLALVLVLPMLTFIAAMATLAGAMLTVWLYSGIPPEVFTARLRDAIDLATVLSGLIKTPFMALIIALIACAEGMAVQGSAESLGRHTTAAVVKSIFMVIVVDGIFAIFFAAIDY